MNERHERIAEDLWGEPESLEEQAQQDVPPADPGDPKTRLLRAILGHCPDHDQCTPDDHLPEYEPDEPDDEEWLYDPGPDDYDMSDPYDIEYDVP